MDDQTPPPSGRASRQGRSPRAGIARHGRLRRPGAVRPIALFLAATLAVVAVSAGSITAIAAWELGRTVSANSVDISDGAALPPALGGLDGGADILLVGSDSRDGQGDEYGDPKIVGTGRLNDANVLLHISADHSRATAISFPRDMLVDIPSCKSEDGKSDVPGATHVMLNTALSRGGLGCVVRTIKSITGIDIPYAGVVQFKGVAAVSDAVGGVPVCLAKPIKDKNADLDLPAGKDVVIQGKQAAEFLRTRHGVGDQSDLDRISNQQVFLGALVRTVTSSDTLTNPAKVYGIARAVVENMSLSTSMDSPAAIASIALTVKDIPADRFTFVQYPSIRRDDGRVDPDTQAGKNLIGVVSSDSDFSLAPGSIGGGVQAPASTPAPSASPGSADAGATSATPDPGTVLPKDVTGQTAAEETCAHG